MVGGNVSASDDLVRAFNVGIPALDRDFLRTWHRVSTVVHRRIPADDLNYGGAAGFAPLREAIAAHIGPSRGVRCRPDQIIITSGAQQAMALVAQLLLDPGDRVIFEEPGYHLARCAFAAAGGAIVPTPVGDEGLQVPAGMAARVAYVTPSHQYPLGVRMTARRRVQLLEWAERTSAWIVEDDYDSEFRYGSRMLPALQGADRAGRVVHVGTFSKVLFPAIRLGYVVVPPALVEPFARAQLVNGGRPPVLEQATLAELIARGHYARHLAKRRRRYANLRGVLTSLIRSRLSAHMTVMGDDTGLHLVGRLGPEVDDRAVADRARKAGLSVPPLSIYYAGVPAIFGLVMGYAHLSERSIAAGVAKLAAILDELAAGPAR
jgi:GntR family transcriptional regulator/MocR family aminotransferase